MDNKNEATEDELFAGFNFEALEAAMGTSEEASHRWRQDFLDSSAWDEIEE